VDGLAICGTQATGTIWCPAFGSAAASAGLAWKGGGPVTGIRAGCERRAGQAARLVMNVTSPFRLDYAV
jgi:hypothetical protein